ncbi:hypothetical protein JJB07_12355 [Tumebacillus sp. ITR2]|uniref:Uncharacterized protein n=1 Tax=Tumebacillus amylolyticus TaxID=2801339 RepID=A0ABS1JAZ1_9BACL|nr:hypothetical protein [Tumebacillus amylolyticus]MBL0387445.1 hypothetical protein [Tumebacillus amylolyticus]
MILSCILVFNLLVLYSFLVSKKHLHLFEILVYFFTFSFLLQDFVAIIWVNLGLVEVTEKIDLYWGVVFNRMILFPILQVWFLNLYANAESWVRKLFLFVIYDAVLVVVIGLTARLGLIKLIHWNLGGAAIYWTVSLLLGIWMRKGFLKLLYAEVKC